MVAAQRGDRDALEVLLRRHTDHIHALCRRMLGNDADGNDATQEALIAIVRGIGRFDGRSRFSTWAHRVAMNACIDELRRRQRRPQSTDADILDFVPTAAATVNTEDETSQRLDIDRALRRLPTDYRAAVVLRDLSGLDYDEIASVLGIPPGTVRSRIARGRARLAALLQVEDGQGEGGDEDGGNPNPTDDRQTHKP